MTPWGIPRLPYQGTFGSSSELSRRLDEFQFTFGEGPCLDSVRQRRPIQVPDLADPAEERWPAYAGAVLGEGVHAVYALPVVINAQYIAALDLFRAAPGALRDTGLAGGLAAAADTTTGHRRAAHLRRKQGPAGRCRFSVERVRSVGLTGTAGERGSGGVHTKTAAVDLALRHLAGQPMTRAEALAMEGAGAIGAAPPDTGAEW